MTFLAITVSIFVLLGIEHIRQQAKSSFSNTVSGIDLIVGARTGDINLLLYSVFRLGNATNNISWSSYQDISTNPKVAWTLPISLGDSHKGYRVMGTTTDYFKHFHYGQKQALTFAQGKVFSEVFDVVLGAEVARKLNYQLETQIILAHGMASTSFSQHNDKPFRIVGILQPTGTPVDRTVHVSLQGIEAVHLKTPHGTDPYEYLEDVHAFPLEKLANAPRHRENLTALPGRKIIFTNADAPYAAKVLKELDLENLFDIVVDIHACDYNPKPAEAAYDTLFRMTGIDPEKSIFFEDQARNLAPAKKRGMTTVWINNGSDLGHLSGGEDHIDDETHCLASWLDNVIETQKIQPAR